MLTESQINQFYNDGYLIIKDAIDKNCIEKCLQAYKKMRFKCENYNYLGYRKFSDIAINDIYAIENIFHPDIFEEDIFKSIINSKVLEISQKLLKDNNVFLSLNRLHCTKNISHSGYWHRDGSAEGGSEEIDRMLIENEKEPIHMQATLPYFEEKGFYIIPGSHKFSNNFIKTANFLGTKKIFNNEVKLRIFPGELLVFNPFIIHRGTCPGRIENQRAHIHMRFTRTAKSNLVGRYKTDEMSFKNDQIYNMANENWKNCFNQKLAEPKIWNKDIIQKKINFLNIKTIFKLLLIAYNRFLYFFSKYLPIHQRTLENIKIIKYPYLKG